MVKENINTLWVTLATISRLSGCPERFTAATKDDIHQDLKNRRVTLSNRQLERHLRELEEEGLIQRKKGILQDGRKILYSLPPNLSRKEVFTLIELGEGRAYVHNGYEGEVVDPPTEKEGITTVGQEVKEGIKPEDSTQRPDEKGPLGVPLFGVRKFLAKRETLIDRSRVF